MRIVVITRRLPPHICGIGDHSVFFADALRSLGHQVVIIAAQGKPSDNITIIEDSWCAKALEKLIHQLNHLKPDHLVLQYTPLAFSTNSGRQPFSIVDFWRSCNKLCKTSLILHETYFRLWWYPPCWISGTVQKRLLKQLVCASDYVFSASQPLIEEIKTWENDIDIDYLPIGSNFQVNTVAKLEMRREHAIPPDNTVLTLFGGGNALRWFGFYVNRLDKFLHKHRIPITWLLLGGVSGKWFTFHFPVISPGFISASELSAWLQITDILLYPHYCGLSAKRGTLMAGLQHALPVIGTKGAMTDRFWDDVPGVFLAPLPGLKKFSKLVIEIIHDRNLREKKGKSNRDYYHMHFTWEKIADRFTEKIS